MTHQVVNKLEEVYILTVRAPANMAHIIQPLDLTVKGSAKSFKKEILLNSSAAKSQRRWVMVSHSMILKLMQIRLQSYTRH